MKMKYVLVLVAVMQIYNAICNETCNMGHIIFYIFIPLAKSRKTEKQDHILR